MKRPYYAHTINCESNFDLKDLETLEKILVSGYVLCRRKMNLDDRYSLFNGMDYVSLCDLSKKYKDNSAYDMYTKQGLSLIFDRNIKVKKPILVHNNGDILAYAYRVHELGMKKRRYSDLYDEVQAKDGVSLEHLQFLAFSLSEFYKKRGNEYLKEYLYSLRDLLVKYQYNVPVIDLDTFEKIKI